jgi:hypothetical protein
MRVGDLYATHEGVGEQAAHERYILHASEMQVGNKLPAPTQQAIVFLADEARTDALPFRRHSLLHGVDCVC